MSIRDFAKEIENMEDRYLFKAKRIDNGEWVVGSYINGGFIIKTNHTECVDIFENTICQCTGLKDKNGNLIWENDIVRDRYGNFYEAFWQNNYYQFSFGAKTDVFSIGAVWNLWSFKSFEIEVIGNKFDDKELEKGE